MNYLVFDLEFNQEFKLNRRRANTISSSCPFEIIDIGGVKLDEDLNTVAIFDALVKPEIYKRLHPFIENMTGITRESLKTAKSFDEVYKEFNEFISDVDILCVWGTADIKELIRNMRYHNIDTSKIPMKFINVQNYASKHLETPGGNRVGLGNAAKLMDIPLEMDLHKAYNDAYYTAEVFKIINNDEIKPDIYNFIDDMRAKRQENRKTVLDTEKLIAQFEKMFNREMSLEDQDIIKLAYKMGHTNQFQK
jgi:DNA polymerase III alpha subunit (gram-positive type)